jgi:hypothetical protein
MLYYTVDLYSLMVSVVHSQESWCEGTKIPEEATTGNGSYR